MSGRVVGGQRDKFWVSGGTWESYGLGNGCGCLQNGVKWYAIFKFSIISSRHGGLKSLNDNLDPISFFIVKVSFSSIIFSKHLRKIIGIIIILYIISGEIKILKTIYLDGRKI